MNINTETKNHNAEEMNHVQDWKSKIEKAVKENKIMVFMKGTAERPACGFSAAVVNTLKNLKLKPGVDFETENLHEHPELFSTLKKLNEWPTSPQIYVNGEFIGGCDIFLQMVKSGEFQCMLQKD